MSELRKTVERFRKALLERDSAALAAMRAAYAEVEGQILGSLGKLLEQAEQARLAGEDVGAGWLFRRGRLEALLGQVRDQLGRFAVFAQGLVLTGQREAVRHAGEDALSLTQAAFRDEAQVSVVWNRVPVEALEQLVGALADGSPVSMLFEGFGEAEAHAARKALITGLATGRNPKRVAASVRDAVGMALPKAQTIVRTETLRAYRSAAVENYRANSDVVDGWVWSASLSGRTCAVCLAMHGTRHPVEEDFGSHPNCRCSPLPLIDGVDYGVSGEEWFSKQSDEVQDSILGSSAGAAYRNGDVTLSDFVGVKESEKWGTTRYVKSLKEMKNGSDSQKNSDDLLKSEATAKSQDMPVKEILRAKENEIRRQRFESAFVYDPSGNLVLGKDGEQYEIAFSSEELRLMKGNSLIHNHPRGLDYPDSDPRSWGNSFSDADIALASVHELAEIRAVTPKQRFSMKPPPEGWSLTYWEKTLLPALKQTNSEVFNDFLRAVDLMSLSKEEAEARHWHEVWSRLAQKLGLVYSQEEG